MTDWIENHYLTEQVEAIKEISDHVTNLKRVGTGMGEYLYDKESLSDWAALITWNTGGLLLNFSICTTIRHWWHVFTISPMLRNEITLTLHLLFV